MRVVGRSRLVEFYEEHRDSKRSLESWFAEVERAEWANPCQIKAQYRTASILKRRKVVFNICGNKYRLVTEVEYSQRLVLMKFMGTHKEYDAIDTETWQ